MTLTSRLLSYLCDDMLQVGAEWSIRTDDSCTLWPHDLAQNITTRTISDGRPPLGWSDGRRFAERVIPVRRWLWSAKSRRRP